MGDDKASVNEMADQKGAALHLQTVGADVNLDQMYGEDCKRKERALVRKVDIRMMPLMMLICEFNNIH